MERARMTAPVLMEVFAILIMENLAFANNVMFARWRARVSSHRALNAVCQTMALKHALLRAETTLFDWLLAEQMAVAVLR